MCRLSWYSEWIDHFECGVRYLQRQLPAARSVRVALIAEDRAVMKRRAEHRQPLAELEHPLMVEIEVLAARERVPRLLALGVDRERRIPPPVRLDPRPLRRRDHDPRLGLGVLELDPITLARRREVRQLRRPFVPPASGTPRPQAVPFVVPESARIASHAYSTRSKEGRPSAIPPRTVPFFAPSSSISCNGFHEAPLTWLPIVSSSGPSAAHRSATCG